MTLRELASKKPGAMLRKLRQLNIGLSNTTYGDWAGKWAIGYHEPTLEEVILLQKLIKENSILLNPGSIDRKLTLRSDWTNRFGKGPTGNMYYAKP